MVRKTVKRSSKKGGFLGNRSGFNAQTYCCDKQNLEDRGGTNCRKSTTGLCATVGANAKMRCFNNYPEEGSAIYENDDCEFVTGAASKVTQTVGTVGSTTASLAQNSAIGAYQTGKAAGNVVGAIGSALMGSGGKRVKKSNKRKLSKRRKTSKKSRLK
jgi:hypothetical protein